MVNVGCGISGRVRVVKENSISGEITKDVEFNNIWTDLGLSYLGGKVDRIIEYPNRLIHGSGQHSGSHEGVTRLKTYVGNTTFSPSFTGDVQDGEFSIDEEFYTLTKTRSTVIPEKGYSWLLAELALTRSSGDGDTLTYALVKNELNIPEPISVSPIEIVTVYYTIQIRLPIYIPPQPMVVEGLPPTTAEFFLKPLNGNLMAYRLGFIESTSYSGLFYGYDTDNFGSGKRPDNMVDGAVIFGITRMDGTTEYIGQNSTRAIRSIWKIDPPIIKDNTQVFEFEVWVTWENIEPIEEEP